MGPPNHAFGQEPPVVAPNEDPAYRAVIRDALSEHDAGHYEEARILFRRAHGIEPNARTLRGIGMASFELRDYVAAVRALEAALVDNRKPLSLELRERTQELLERARLFVDAYLIKTDPPDAQVVIDGQAPEPEPDGSVLLGFGSHSIEATKAGYIMRTFPIKVHGGERKELIVNLEREHTPVVEPPKPLPRPVGAATPPSPVVPAAPPPVVPAPPQAATPEARNASVGWYWAAGGAAVIGLAAAIYWGLEDSQLRSCRSSSDGLSCDNESAIETKRNLAIGGTAAAGAAAVTMAVIGVLRRKIVSDARAESALSCVVLPAGVSCTKPF